MKKITLLAKDFKGTSFLPMGNMGGENPECGCAIEKAMFRVGIGSKIQEAVVSIRVDGVDYNHDPYEPSHFLADQLTAEAAGFDDTVIREFELKEGI